MSTNRLSFSELFYHKSSALRVELNTYNDKVRFKIEVIPALKDASGAPVLSASGKPKFDYDAGLSMLFSHVELLRIKKIIENILNPNKKTGDQPGDVPANGYALEHFFEVTTNNVKEKKKSAITFKRMENNYKPKSPSPFDYKYVVGVSMFSSAKSGNVAIVLSEDEAYWFMNMLPLLALEVVKEGGRVNNENKPATVTGTKSSATSAGTPAGAPKAATPPPTAGPPPQQDPPVSDETLEDWSAGDIPF